MKTTIIFDLDGTLVDSASVCTRILNSMLRDRGSDRILTVCQAKPYLSRGGTAMVAGLLGEDCGSEVDSIREFRTRYSQMPTPTDSLYQGVRSGLERLHAQGIRLAICSNKPQNLCEQVLEDLELAHLFSAVVGGGPDRRPKPDPHLLDLTLEALGAGPDECVFVGDSDLDELTAKAVGVPFYFVSYGYAPDDWCTRQLDRFDHFSDLTRTLERVCAPHVPLRRVA